MISKHAEAHTSDPRTAIWQHMVGHLADCLYEVRLTPNDTLELLHADDFLLRLVGYTRTDLVDWYGGWYALIHPDDRATVQASYTQLREQPHSTCDFRIVTRNGSIVWLRSWAYALPPSAPAIADSPLQIIGALRDVTCEHLPEPDPALLQRMHAVAWQINDGILLLDAQGTIKHAVLDDTSLHDLEQLQLHTYHMTEIIYPEDYNLALSHLAALLAEPTQRVRLVLRVVSPQQAYRWIEVTAVNCIGDALLNGIVVSYRDISGQKRQEELVWKLAYTDDLTGLANRRQIYQMGNFQLAEYAASGRYLALLYLDLDRFKIVNDTMGHDAGDDLLIQVAERLHQCVAEPSLLARVGGDEFAVLIPDADVTYALEIARTLISRINQPFQLRGQLIYLDCSVGITISDPDTRQFSTLLTQADIAMYHAKSASGGVRVFEQATTPPHQNRLLLEAEFRTALTQNALTLYYQPITDIATNQIIALEALIRWEHPTLGILPPGAFLPLAEEIGLLGILDRWVLKHAMQQLAAWHAQGLRVVVSINLTADSLRDPELVFDIEDLLSEYDLSPEYVILEITEHAALHDILISQQVLGTLRQIGVQIALDDFGTGYASLTYLRQLPVSILKLDGSFAAGVGENPADEAVMQALISLGRGLHLTVIVEGIEYPHQREWLRSTDSQLLQGFLLGRPASVEMITAHLHVQQNGNLGPPDPERRDDG
ncbi:MAG: EAL domain-containing protein [Chloroflexaceae bacterium]|nr:EAL domain-containing protein [Chloroflexaceae bacterium]